MASTVKPAGKGDAKPSVNLEAFTMLQARSQLALASPLRQAW